jgi:hypothetical protein
VAWATPVSETEIAPARPAIAPARTNTEAVIAHPGTPDPRRGGTDHRADLFAGG